MVSMLAEFAKMENGKRLLLMTTFPVSRVSLHSVRLREMNFGFYYWKRLGLRFMEAMKE
jgi:hypothetical protein